MMDNDYSDLIWPDELYCLHPMIKSLGMLVTYSERKKYIRADLAPRWRPIAELPPEWKDGRQVMIKNARGHVFVCEWQTVNGQNWGWYNGVGWLDDADIAAFMDFCGKAMPE